MCGILVFSSGFQGDIPQLRQAVACRGPDHYGSVAAAGFNFESSVLSLRTPLTEQPLTEDGSVLCYNGEIYNHSEVHDTVYVQKLCRAGKFDELFSSEGEFAFVYFDGKDTITFGRDVCGRRSLVFALNDDSELLISSLGLSTPNVVECDGAGKLYQFSLATKTVSEVQAIPYNFKISRSVSASDETSNVSPLSYLRSAVESRIAFPDSESGVGVLFSGGLDCSIITALLDDLLPEGKNIDLMNVAFENKRTGSKFDTPDRKLARKTFEELKLRSPHAHNRMRLVEVDVPYEEAVAQRETVQTLMAPTATVMDLSIAIAFYFASKPEQVDSGRKPPRILFSGLGADELFAGYSRHVNFASDPEKLAEELEMDFLRLPHRNLGRDDRVCASWGREVRYPFLDNRVVELAQRLPLSSKTDGTDTKIALRTAASELQLGDVVREKKRAIQFGARSAKMDPGSGNSKGHHAL